MFGTYLKELSDSGVDHHEGPVDEMHHAVLDRNVGVHNFGHHHAGGVAVVANDCVAAHIGWNTRGVENIMNSLC